MPQVAMSMSAIRDWVQHHQALTAQGKRLLGPFSISEQDAWIPRDCHEIRLAVQKIRQNLQLPTEQLRVTLDSTQSALTQLQWKLQSVLDSLQSQERQLVQEVEQWQERLVVEGRPLLLLGTPGAAGVNQKSLATAGAASALSDGAGPPEVEAYHEFMRRYHGKCSGSWSDEDHGIFLRLSSRYAKNPREWMRLVQAQTGRSQEDVEQHAEFYRQWVKLNQARKEAIARWRLQRTNLQHQSLVTEEQLLDEEALLNRERDDQHQLMEQKKLQLVEEKKQRQQVKQSIQQWKVEKERAQLEQEQRQRELEDRKRERLAKAREEEREQRRRWLEEQKLKKQVVQNDVSSTTENTPRPASIDPQLLRRRGEAAIQQTKQKRLEQLQKQQQSALELQKRLEKAKQPVLAMLSTAEPKIQADKDRLYRPTLAMKERQYSELYERRVRRNSDGMFDPKEFFTPGRGIVGARILPKRHVPSWRQGL